VYIVSEVAGASWSLNAAWFDVWSVVVDGDAAVSVSDVIVKRRRTGWVTVAWELKRSASGWFGSDCSRFRGISKWFEAVGLPLVTDVDSIGNIDGGCAGNDGHDMADVGNGDGVLGAI
jgi:hypothetical protein